MNNTEFEGLTYLHLHGLQEFWGGGLVPIIPRQQGKVSPESPPARGVQPGAGAVCPVCLGGQQDDPQCLGAQSCTDAGLPDAAMLCSQRGMVMGTAPGALPEQPGQPVPTS